MGGKPKTVTVNSIDSNFKAPPPVDQAHLAALDQLLKLSSLASEGTRAGVTSIKIYVSELHGGRMSTPALMGTPQFTALCPQQDQFGSSSRGGFDAVTAHDCRN